MDDSMAGRTDEDKVTTARTGNPHWTPVRPFLEAVSHGKCWYTESKNSGSLFDVDHFRPKRKVLDREGMIDHWYWFLAFNPINYRLSCQISNRRNRNPIMGATGGKGDNFPLMPGSTRATNLAGIVDELPLILDPCNEADAGLLEFQPDGRPVVSIGHATEAESCSRVEQSKLLLNLDFPTFNEDRERLYNRIKTLVERGDSCGAENPAIEDVKNDLRSKMSPEAEYSKAAECYIRCFRDRPWVEELVLGL
jgi:hypothetical protein